MAPSVRSRPRSRRATLAEKFTRSDKRRDPRYMAPFIEEVTPQSTAWELYNHKAEIKDWDLIRDWNDTLNTLLIFVSTPRLFVNSTLITRAIGGPFLGYPDRFHHRKYEAIETRFGRHYG
jgi:hypothetical protein